MSWCCEDPDQMYVCQIGFGEWIISAYHVRSQRSFMEEFCTFIVLLFDALSEATHDVMHSGHMGNGGGGQMP